MNQIRRAQFLVTLHIPGLPTLGLVHQLPFEWAIGSTILSRGHGHHLVLVPLNVVTPPTLGLARFLALVLGKEPVLDHLHHPVPAKGRRCDGDEACPDLYQDRDLQLRHAGSQDQFLVQSHLHVEAAVHLVPLDLRHGKRLAGTLLQ